jgi:isopentenyl-diphosphate delta-isomerase type 1
MAEFLDIVDEDDEVIGRDTRENVHARHKTHRGVHVFVLNSRGEILLQKRSEKRDYYPGYYDASVGAHVLSGETYKQAAKRETKEELGFQPSGLERICDYNSYSARQKEKRRLFVCHSEGPFDIDTEEVESVEWWPPERIREEIERGKMKFTEGFKLSFRKFIKHTHK